MEFRGRVWTPQEKIEMLQRYVLVHSYLYYVMDTSIVSDYKYDSNSNQLLELKVKYPEDWDKARYTYVMKEFDGSTGFGFVNNLKEKEMVSIMWDVKQLTSRHFIKR